MLETAVLSLPLASASLESALKFTSTWILTEKIQV